VLEVHQHQDLLAEVLREETIQSLVVLHQVPVVEVLIIMETLEDPVVEVVVGVMVPLVLETKVVFLLQKEIQEVQETHLLVMLRLVVEVEQVDLVQMDL
tara:strand:- start:79 stop:375 length:297 start_codon:yes stop_codon:yes gene_type:complete